MRRRWVCKCTPSLTTQSYGLAKNGKDYTPKDLHAFADVSFGKKLDYIDDSWFEPLDGGADNKLRNAIAHFKTDYDQVKQIVTYYAFG